MRRLSRPVVVALVLVTLTAAAACDGSDDAPSSSATVEMSRAPARSPSPTPTKSSGDVTLAFGGDVHFTGRTAHLLDDPAAALSPIANALSAADLTMLNLETAVTTGGEPTAKRFHFRAAPTVFDALRASGVDVVTMANNHAVDYGPAGLADTLAAIEHSGFPVVGIGADDAAAYAPYVTEINGVKIAIFAATDVADITAARYAAGQDKAGVASARNPDRLVARIRDVRPTVDVVVVNLHWGPDYVQRPTREQQALAGKLAAAGADVVVGSHAHVQLGAGWLGRTYVAYGLGNFVWWRSRSPAEVTTGLLVVHVADKKVVGAAWEPARINGRGLPVFLDGADATDAIDAWSRLRASSGLAAGPTS